MEKQEKATERPAEIRAMCLQAKEPQGLPATARSWRRRQGPPWSVWREEALPTPRAQLWPSELRENKYNSLGS